MSAPPPVAMPTAVMTTAPVSRLPKFTASSASSSSSRLTKPALTPKNSSNINTNTPVNANANANMGQAASVNNSVISTTSRITNGFYHHTTPGGKSSPVSANANGKQNGCIRAPTNFTAKWRKENVEDVTSDFEYKSGKNQNCKKAVINNSTTKASQRVLTPNAVSTPKVIPKSVNTRLTQKTTLNCLAKKQNGGSLTKSRSVSPLEVKKPAAGRSHSSDSIGAVKLTSDKLKTTDKVRSRSLTQVQRQQSANAAIPAVKSRAYSTNRAKPGSGSVGAGSGLPVATVKKPLLPKQNGGSTFKIRTALFKEPGPIRVQADLKRNQRRNSVETPSDPGSSPEAPDSRGLSSERGSQTEVSLLGETLEDMSLSSTSSLEHHHSQEYMDDFDNLGDGGVGMMLTSCCHHDDDDSGLDRSRFHDDGDCGDGRPVVRGVSGATELCFLDDGLDWNHIRLTGDRDHLLRRLSRGRRSSQPDYQSQCGSSLDLSPSDSCGSGGTFLWDEEVEPLGGVVPIQNQSLVQIPVQVSVRTNPGLQNGFHQNQVQTKPDQDRTNSLHVGSLNSDLSSIDALNDLESCDLDEDDLMLDVDFPEENSLTSDGGSHMAEWRRRQLCWGTTDGEFHTDGGGVREEQKRKDSQLSLDLCLNSVKCPVLGLEVEELMDDCSAVKSQLEYLHKLLLLQEDEEEDTLTTDTLSPETDSSSDGTETQVEVLLQEVLQLREEVRSRDRTIAELSQQLSAVSEVSSRCHCHSLETTEAQTQTREKETENTESQTPWGTSAILQSNQSLEDALTAEDHGKRSPLPSRLRLLMFPGSSPFRPTHSPGSRKKLSPAPSCASPSLSRLPKPKTH